MSPVLAVVVGALAVLGVGASIAHFAKEPYNPGFALYPVVTSVHVILGGVYLALAPLQFSERIRDRWPRYHRAAGRALVAIGAVVGPTALFLATVVPYSGWSERIIVGGFAVFYTGALLVGFARVRARRYAEHREWMMRAFAIGLGIATMRLIFVPLLIWSGDPEAWAELLSIVSFALAFSIHAAAAEWWIRTTRRRPDGGGRRTAVLPLSASPAASSLRAR